MMANKYTATPLPDKDVLYKLYHDDFLTLSEVAVKMGVTVKIVQRWFKKLSIKTRKPFKRNQKGAQNSYWKGDDVTYATFHKRVESVRGKPSLCMICGTMEKRVYEWANLTGNYSDIYDYTRMCRPCHKKYDKNRKKSSQHVKRKAK